MTTNEITYKVMLITPELAKTFLAMNSHNRNLRTSQVERMARDMAEGRWFLNGETIKFSDTDDLLDGQHRLAACVLANISFTTLVVFGLTAEMQESVDDGIKRTNADRFHLRGVVNQNVVAAALNLYWRYINDAERQSAAAPTFQESAELLENNPGIRDSAKVGEVVRRTVPTSPSLVAATHYIFSTFDFNAANDFFDKLHTGADMHDGHPVLRLRETIMKNRLATRKVTTITMWSFYVKAWNAFRKDEDVAFFRLLPGEEFPKPQ